MDLRAPMLAAATIAAALLLVASNTSASTAGARGGAFDGGGGRSNATNSSPLPTSTLVASNNHSYELRCSPRIRLFVDGLMTEVTPDFRSLLRTTCLLVRGAALERHPGVVSARPGYSAGFRFGFLVTADSFSAHEYVPQNRSEPQKRFELVFSDGQPSTPDDYFSIMYTCQYSRPGHYIAVRDRALQRRSVAWTLFARLACRDWWEGRAPPDSSEEASDDDADSDERAMSAFNRRLRSTLRHTLQQQQRRRRTRPTAAAATEAAEAAEAPLHVARRALPPRISVRPRPRPRSRPIGSQRPAGQQRPGRRPRGVADNLEPTRPFARQLNLSTHHYDVRCQPHRETLNADGLQLRLTHHMQNVVEHLCSQVPIRLRLSGAPISLGSIATSNFDPTYYAVNSTHTQRYRVDVLYADGKRRGFRNLLLPVNVRCGEVPKVSCRGHALAKWSLAWGLLVSMRCGSPALPPSSPAGQRAAATADSDEELNGTSDDAARWRILQSLRPPLTAHQPAPPDQQPRQLIPTLPQISSTLVSSNDPASFPSLNELGNPHNISTNYSQLYSSSGMQRPEISSKAVLHTVTLLPSVPEEQTGFSRQSAQFEHNSSSNPYPSQFVSHVGDPKTTLFPDEQVEKNSPLSETTLSTLDSDILNKVVVPSLVDPSQLSHTFLFSRTNEPPVSEASSVDDVLLETSPTAPLASSWDMPRVQERRHNSATEPSHSQYETIRERMYGVHYKNHFLDDDSTPTQQPLNMDDGEVVGEMLPHPEPLNSILDVSGKHESNDLEENEDPHNHTYILRCAESAALTVDSVEARVTSHMEKALFFLCALLSSAQGARTAEFDFGAIRTVESYRTEDVALFGDGDDSLDVLYKGNANPGTEDVNIFWQTCRPDPPGPEFSLDSGPLLPHSILWSLFSKVRCGGDRDDSSAGADRYFSDDVFPEEMSSEEVVPAYSNWHNYVIRCLPGKEALLVDGVEMLMTAHMDSALTLLCFSSGLHGLNATRNLGRIRSTEFFNPEEYSVTTCGQKRIDVLYKDNISRSDERVSSMMPECQATPPRFLLNGCEVRPGGILWRLYRSLLCGAEDLDDQGNDESEWLVNAEHPTPLYIASNVHSYAVRCRRGSERLLVDGARVRTTRHLQAVLRFLCDVIEMSVPQPVPQVFSFGNIATRDSFATAEFASAGRSFDVQYIQPTSRSDRQPTSLRSMCEPEVQFTLDGHRLAPHTLVWSLFRHLRCGQLVSSSRNSD